MSKRPFVILMLSLVPVLWLVLALSINAQDNPPPVPYTPGVPVITVVPTLDPTVCPQALPIKLNTQIFIKPGVNIRNNPTESGALVWNTIYDNYDDDGNVVDNPVSVAVTVVEEPVCAGAQNWWRVVGLDAPGWVAEGRPDKGYLIIVPGLDSGTCNAVYSFTANTRADLLLNAKVHAEPSLDGLVKTVAPAGTPVFIVGGGKCVEGKTWWLVRVTVVDFTYEGWMADSEDGNYYLVPTDLPNTADGTLCSDPLNLAIGQSAYVNTRNGAPKSLRSAPGENSPLLFSLVDNVPLIIASSSVCKDNLNWWKVRVLASTEVIGWMAEGSAGVGYWISTINPNEFAK